MSFPPSFDPRTVRGFTYLNPDLLNARSTQTHIGTADSHQEDQTLRETTTPVSYQADRLESALITRTSLRLEKGNFTLYVGEEKFGFLDSKIVSRIFPHLILTSCQLEEPLVLNDAQCRDIVYEQFAFSSEKWEANLAIRLNENLQEERDSTPWKEFLIDSMKFKAISDFMLVRIPKSLGGELTLESFGQITSKRLFKPVGVTPANPGYWGFSKRVFESIGKKPLDKSRWVIMTRTNLAGSQNLSFDDQSLMIRNLLPNYEAPDALTATTAIVTQLFNQYLPKSEIGFRNGEFTRCVDTAHLDQSDTVLSGNIMLYGDYMHVGSTPGPTIADVSKNTTNHSIGIAAIRTFD